MSRSTASQRGRSSPRYNATTLPTIGKNGSTTTMQPGESTDLETVRGVLLERGERGVVIGLAGTDYRIHLKVQAPLEQAEGSPVRGRIEAQARRLDRTAAGGRYMEPLYGRPRRLQGPIVMKNDAENCVTVRSACLVRCRLGSGQQASDFRVGDFVTFDVEPDALFVPAS